MGRILQRNANQTSGGYMMLKNIEKDFKRFDLISKRFIYSLKKEFIYGKKVKRVHKVQAD